MDALYTDALGYIAVNMTNGNLGNNVLYWTSYNKLADQSNQAQRFAPTGDPVVIFNREHVVGHVGSYLGVCNQSLFTRFLPGESNVYIQTSYDDYVANPVCNGTLFPPYFGHIYGVNSGTFESKLDIRSLFTAMAVNLGILDFNDIVQIQSVNSTLTVDNVAYNYSDYYDPKFPGMRPITCIYTEDRQFCTIRMGLVFTIPFFHHQGNNSQLPQQCICGEISVEDLENPYSDCNVFKFIAGVTFWQTNVPDPLFRIIEYYNYSFSTINDLSYQAAFVSSYWGQTSQEKEYLNSESYLQNAFSFCNITTDGPCSILTVSAFDTSEFDWTVSKYYYQLQRGTCSASLTPSPVNW
jgi:hypothetical protein